TRSKRDWSSDVCSSDLGVDVVHLLYHNDLLDQLSVSAYESDAHTCGKYLRERRAVQHAPVCIHAFECRHVLAVKAKLSVRVVLKYDCIILLDKSHDRPALFVRHRDAGRVLEGGNKIYQLGARVLPERFFKHFNVYAVGLDIDADKLGI